MNSKSQYLKFINLFIIYIKIKLICFVDFHLSFHIFYVKLKSIHLREKRIREPKITPHKYAPTIRILFTMFVDFHFSFEHFHFNIKFAQYAIQDSFFEENKVKKGVFHTKLTKDKYSSKRFFRKFLLALFCRVKT